MSALYDLGTLEALLGEPTPINAERPQAELRERIDFEWPCGCSAVAVKDALVLAEPCSAQLRSSDPTPHAKSVFADDTPPNNPNRRAGLSAPR
jgi:hypothetical protein